MTCERQPLAVSHDPIEAARVWLGEYGRVALATVVSTWGSSPVPVGGQLVVSPDERFEGSVSGGCVEAEVIQEAAGVIAGGRPKLLEFGVSSETAWRAGLPCGGRIEVFLEAMDAAHDLSYVDAVLKARAERSPLAVQTWLSDGIREVFDPRHGETSTMSATTSCRESRVLDTPDGRAFLHVLAPKVHVIIIGATHIGQVLSDLARRIGYSVSVIDPRSAFASEDRFEAIERDIAWPKASRMLDVLDKRTAVVALTHVAHIDDEALAAALDSACFYVGALGSRHSHAARMERLRTTGVSEEALTRIHAPVGLSIGAKGPEEIAVSILAEIVKAVREAGAA